jgi:hypothetical protein
MRSRLFMLTIVLALVFTSLGVNVRPATAITTGVTVTCNSVTVTGTTTPLSPVLVTVVNFSGFPPIVGSGIGTADISGSYSITVSHSAAVGSLVGVFVSDPISTGSPPQTVPACVAGFQGFNPGDARVAGRPGDRVVVYCNTNTTGANANTIVVFGVLDDSQGKFLTSFNVADVRKAGGKGITRSVEPLGTVYISLSGTNSFYVKWMGGPADATGTGDFRKRFTCDFAS